MPAIKTPNLTMDRLREALAFNADTGVFTWAKPPKGKEYLTGRPAGCLTSHYVVLRLDSTFHLAHRLAWFYHYGAWPSDFVDHVNGDKKDNRIANLRLAANWQNNHNQPNRTKNKSGVRGVSWDKTKKKWAVEITVNCMHHRLGRFDTLEEAKAVRLAAEQRFLGEFSYSASQQIMTSQSGES